MFDMDQFVETVKKRLRVSVDPAKPGSERTAYLVFENPPVRSHRQPSLIIMDDPYEPIQDSAERKAKVMEWYESLDPASKRGGSVEMKEGVDFAETIVPAPLLESHRKEQPNGS